MSPGAGTSRRAALLVASVVVLIAGGTAVAWFVVQPQSAPAQSSAQSSPPAMAGPPSGTSSGSRPTAPSTSTAPGGGSPSSTTQPAAGAGARGAVRRAWTSFFTGSTPLATRERLLVHGARFSSALHALSTSSIARKSGATVQTVAVHPGGTADVGYIIDVDGTPALPHQHGTARRRGGRWKVGDATFCHLVGIEGKHPSACSGVAAGAATGGSS